jgi:hypothetical protein
MIEHIKRKEKTLKHNRAHKEKRNLQILACDELKCNVYHEAIAQGVKLPTCHYMICNCPQTVQ